MEQAGDIKTPFDFAIHATMKRASAVGISANRISLFRDTTGDGVADVHEYFVEDQMMPFGMELNDGTFYIGNTNGIVSFKYNDGDTQLSGEAVRHVEFKPYGHWTRSLLASPDGSKLYAGVGSLSNIADKGFEAEEGRAAIYAVSYTHLTLPTIYSV